MGVGQRLQSVYYYIYDFLDDVCVALFVLGYFCEGVLYLLLFHVGRVDNLDVEVLGGQLKVFHHFELADELLFILIAYPGHIFA